MSLRLGLLGGGQLGRMIALEARRLGVRTTVLDPEEDGPAAQVCDRHIRAELSDAGASRELARASDVVTLEWELIPLETLRAAEALGPVLPSSRELSLLQDRLTQKTFLADWGIAQAPFRPVASPKELEDAVARLGLPAVLKRRRHGYDGKGQLLLRGPGDLEEAGVLLEAPCVLEAFVPFRREVSVVLARSRDGALACYPLAENVHRDAVLHATFAPAAGAAKAEARARRIAGRIASALGHVGVMAVELFELKDGRLLVNEIAPRVHNSGHFTYGACDTSQFEQHLRAVLGLPLGSARQHAPAAMLNLLGGLWGKGEPDWGKILAEPGARLHLYGKAHARPGRKMGHVLLLGRDARRRLPRLERRLELI